MEAEDSLNCFFYSKNGKDIDDLLIVQLGYVMITYRVFLHVLSHGFKSLFCKHFPGAFFSSALVNREVSKSKLSLEYKDLQA